MASLLMISLVSFRKAKRSKGSGSLGTTMVLPCGTRTGVRFHADNETGRAVPLGRTTNTRASSAERRKPPAISM